MNFIEFICVMYIVVGALFAHGVIKLRNDRIWSACQQYRAGYVTGSVLAGAVWPFFIAVGIYKAITSRD